MWGSLGRAMVGEFGELKGTASGNLVATSITVKIYLCPRAEEVRGPTRSIAILEYGSPIIGICTRGTLRTLPLGEDF